jgi:hypothetical protein
MVGSREAPTVLIRRLVVASGAAGFTVVEPVDAEAHVDF